MTQVLTDTAVTEFISSFTRRNAEGHGFIESICSVYKVLGLIILNLQKLLIY